MCKMIKDVNIKNTMNEKIVWGIFNWSTDEYHFKVFLYHLCDFSSFPPFISLAFNSVKEQKSMRL